MSERVNDIMRFFKKDEFLKSVPYILLFTGLACYIVGSLEYVAKAYSYWATFLVRTGGLLLVSVLTSFVLNASRYMGVFREAIQEVIYDHKYLENCKNLESIWIKVSTALIQRRFPNVSKELMDTIKRQYLSVDVETYYENYRAFINIEWLDRESQWIRLTYDVDFELNVESPKKLKYPFRSWTLCGSLSSDSPFPVETKITKFTVDGVDAEVITDGATVKDGEKIEKFHIDIEGKTNYSIKETLVKTMCLKDDNYSAFNCKWLVRNMQFTATFPSDMAITVVGKGTERDFDKVHQNNNSITYEYKGLILRSQGYLFIISTK